MQAAFWIRLDDPARLLELERLFVRAGASSFAEGDSLHVLLQFDQPCTDEQAFDEVRFAVRAAYPDGLFTVEPAQDQR